MNRRDFISYCCLCILSILSVKKVFNDFTVKNASMLNYVEVQIADHCNLNCKYCSHFSPIADTHFYDLKQYEKEHQCGCKLTNVIKNNAVINANKLTEKDGLLKDYVQNKGLKIVPAYYHLDSGEVEFLN